MLGFSFPKILLLIIIILLVWNFFKLLEKKIIKNNQKKSRSDNNKIYDEALTECPICGIFYSKNHLNKCTKSKCPRNN